MRHKFFRVPKTRYSYLQGIMKDGSHRQADYGNCMVKVFYDVLIALKTLKSDTAMSIDTYYTFSAFQSTDMGEQQVYIYISVPIWRRTHLAADQ